MRNILRLIFFLIFAAMVYVTVTASMSGGVFADGSRLWPEPWFRATLADAYFGFVTVFVWIAYRERSWAARAVWFVLLMTTGNLAISAYCFVALSRLGPEKPLGTVFLPPARGGRAS